MKIKLIKIRYLVRKRILLTIMRTFIFMLCTTIFGFSSENSFSQEEVTIDVDKIVSVDEVFVIIQQQTEYRFLYPQDLFLNKPKVKLKKGVIKVTDLLKQSLHGNKLNFKLSDGNIIEIKETENISIDNNRQNVKVSGIITDEIGMPLPGANILEKGTLNGIQTDFNGKYTLAVFSKESILVISYLGSLASESRDFKKPSESRIFEFY